MKSSSIQQVVGDVQSFIRQKVHSSMKIVRVNIYQKLISISIKEEQKLNVSVVNYVSSKSNAKSELSRMNKIHKYRHLLKVLWKSNYLYYNSRLDVKSKEEPCIEFIQENSIKFLV